MEKNEAKEQNIESTSKDKKKDEGFMGDEEVLSEEEEKELKEKLKYYGYI